MIACSPARLALVLACCIALPGGAMAQMRGGWDAGGWGRTSGPGREVGPERQGPDTRGPDAREGRVSAERFPASDAGALLGHGAIAVGGGERPAPPAAPPADADRGPDKPPVMGPAAPEGAPPIRALPESANHDGDEAVFEAAVVDALARAGYDTAHPAAGTAAGNGAGAGQIARVRVERRQLLPAEAPHKPVSGAMEMGVSNRGSMMGLALNFDMTKPRAALVETRLAVVITEAGSGRRLWEGHAEIATREGSSHWPAQRIAGTLAGALFAGFPAASDLTRR